MAVTPAEVQRMPATCLTPDQVSLVVVGEKATVGEQLAPFQQPLP